MSSNCCNRRHLRLFATLAAWLLSASALHAATSTFGAANWAGYVAQYTGTGSTAETGVANYVGASWTVPTASASLLPSASASNCQCAVFIGLDGFSDSTVEQVGTSSNYDNGVTNYYAWYEMFPNGPVTEFSVQPGDSISASVEYNPPGDPGTFLLSLTDNTQDKSFPMLYETNASAKLSSAEWIVEAPSGFGIAPLPDVGDVTFTGATTTFGTESGPVDDSDWETWQIIMKPGTKSSPAYADDMLPGLPVDSGDGPATSSFIVAQIAPEPSSAGLLAALAATAGGIGALARRRRIV